MMDNEDNAQWKVNQEYIKKKKRKIMKIYIDKKKEKYKRNQKTIQGKENKCN